MLLNKQPYKELKKCLDILFKEWDKLGIDIFIRLGENLKKYKTKSNE